MPDLEGDPIYRSNLASVRSHEAAHRGQHPGLPNGNDEGLGEAI
jgi:hypothetical protein